MESLILGIVGISLPGDTSHKLRDDNQIDDERRGQQGILADVEDAAIRFRTDLSISSEEFDGRLVLTRLSGDHP